MYIYLVMVFFTLSVEALVITIDQGTLNGTYSTTRRGKRFNAFYGIPFAQPPVGDLRFKPPKVAKSWNGIFDASGIPVGCLQSSSMSADGIYGNEDCLNLNVYTPLGAREGDNLSVIVYIFGGVYKWFTNMEFEPQYILERNIILVIPNYRLGALGFMTTGDTVISGNYQLKDQTMALKWVQKNIRSFGGNPNDVTLQGHSAASSCVHLHTLSPMSKGLFHKAVMQSGASMNSFYGLDVIREIAKEFATKAGCPNITSSGSMLSCFITLDAKLFPLIEQTMYIWDMNPAAVFKPSLEDENSEEPFISKMPSTSQYHTPDMPWIIGLTTGESAYKVARFLGNGGELAAEINKYYRLLLPISLEYFWDTKLSHLNYVSEMLRTHYFGNREIGPKTAHEMTELYSHGMFGIPIMNTIRNYPGPKFVYWYDYKSNYSRQNVAGYYEKYLGVSHGEEVYLLYYTEESDNALTYEDHKFSEELVNRWVNFAETGNPNLPVQISPDIMDYWIPMITDRIEYLRIKLHGSMETDLYKGIYDFWIRLPIGDKYDDLFAEK